MKLEISQQIFEKHSSITFHESPSNDSRVVYHADGRTDGQTDRHDDANSHFSQFCGRA